MGGKHSSTGSIGFDNFPVDTPSPFEHNDCVKTRNEDIRPDMLLIPLTGTAPPLQTFQDMWFSGSANPTSLLLNTNYEFRTGADTKKYDPLPGLGPSGCFSLIRLDDDDCTINHFVHANQVESEFETLYFKYHEEVDPGSFPNFNFAGVSQIVQFSALYQRLHVLSARFIFHQVMKKGKLIYYGPKTIQTFKHDSHEYALIQHPIFYSRLISTAVNLQHFYPPHSFDSFCMKHFIVQPIPFNLVRSGLSFHTLPTASYLDSDLVGWDRHKNVQTAIDNSHKPSQFISIPFSILYVDSTDPNSVHNVYSFIYAFKLGMNSSTTFFNTKQTVFIIIRNADKLDRDQLMTETVMAELFDAHLPSVVPVFYPEICEVPVSNQSTLRSYEAENINSTCKFYSSPTDPWERPSYDYLYPKDNTRDQQSLPEDLQRSADDLLQMLNQHLFKLIPSQLLTETFSRQRKLLNRRHDNDDNDNENNGDALVAIKYKYIFPKPNLSTFSPILPLFTTQYQTLLTQLHLHNLHKQNIHYLPLCIYTFGLNNYFALRDGPVYGSKKHPIPGYNLQDFRDAYDVELEFLVQVGSFVHHDDARSVFCPMDNTSLNINRINVKKLNDTPGTVQICTPEEHETTKVRREKDILDEVGVELEYPLDSQSASTSEVTIGLINSKSGELNQSYSFQYRGEDPTYINQPYVAKINHFQSPPNNEKQVQVRIIASDLHRHKTCASRVEPLTESTPLGYKGGTVVSALPMNQILAFEAFHGTNSSTHSTTSLPTPRYLVHLTNHIRTNAVSFAFNFMRNTMLSNPNFFPAICIVDVYSTTSPLFAREYITSHCGSQKEALSKISIHIPVILVMILPYHFDINTSPFPNLSQSYGNYYGSELTEDERQWLKSKAERQKDNEAPPSTQDIAMHSRIIQVRMAQIAQYLTDDGFEGESAQFPKRTVYHFVVNGVPGYFDALPLINQCALAHYFSLAAQ